MVKASVPLEAADEAFRMIEPPSLISERAFCTVKSVPIFPRNRRLQESTCPRPAIEQYPAPLGHFDRIARNPLARP